ncbi:hypothetical protein M409DRAFT_57481 [Zasmidium cellare ATCC 36951]|uniref:Uncharacterized protein n=1 Tax=Zasmidium cellare ATCC 36951 TaxID=1080233 RepID=A0A6A6CCF9_ZASCE|nr:uncharacterized protein M409DRAFT_57481 [Zasmidium cellare ATCC 36951]KAF2163602.1 hypothetical protein M409DRAFT_57481 [Zasmidium cellare ATCC 36951]
MSSWNRTPKLTQDGASKPVPEKRTIDPDMVRERLQALQAQKAEQADAQLKATREKIRQLAAKKAAKKAAAEGGEKGEVQKTPGPETTSAEGDAKMKTGEKKELSESFSNDAKGGSAGSVGGTGQGVEPKGWAGGSDDEDDDEDDDSDDYDD